MPILKEEDSFSVHFVTTKGETSIYQFSGLYFKVSSFAHAFPNGSTHSQFASVDRPQVSTLLIVNSLWFKTLFVLEFLGRLS